MGGFPTSHPEAAKEQSGTARSKNSVQLDCPGKQFFTGKIGCQINQAISGDTRQRRTQQAGQNADCDRCAGAGIVSEDETCQTCNGTGEGEFIERGVTTYCPDCKWMDPAGGLHDHDEDDPAAMYEEEGEHRDCERCGGIGRGGDPDDPFSKCLACMGTGKDTADCERCKGTGSESAAGNPLASFGDENDDCVLCGGTGKEDFVRGTRQDPFGGNYGVDVEDYMDEDSGGDDLFVGDYLHTTITNALLDLDPSLDIGGYGPGKNEDIVNVLVYGDYGPDKHMEFNKATGMFEPEDYMVGGSVEGEIRR